MSALRIADSRIDLQVPFPEKDEAKAMGARWDPVGRTWYAPAGSDLDALARWLPAVEQELPLGQQGTALSDFLARVRAEIGRGLPRAEWIRAEISELREKNGTLFLGLTERDERGDATAACRAIVWSREARALQRKFEQATGGPLRPDIRLLLLARAGFHVLYGFSLQVEDVDPSWTLGELEAKLRRIRERLAAEGLAELNRKLPAPRDFSRVAVLSPEGAAGLGDFRQEADALERLGLCRFVYFHAAFQGPQAPAELRRALALALEAHAERAFDACALIRGGGARTDLAWLNDLELARDLARAPLPVLCGIGHERDATIVDEVAHRSFATPSKLSQFIHRCIVDQGQQGLRDLERIRERLAALLARQNLALDELLSQIDERSLATAAGGSAACAAQLERLSARTRLYARAALREIGSQRRRLAAGARSSAGRAASGLDGLAVALGRPAALLASAAGRSSALAMRELAGAARRRLDSAAGRIDALAERVTGLGPEATLRRGYALVTDSLGRPVGTRRAAAGQAELALRFTDGTLRVANLEREEDT
ncbi:MAG: exodeoxyribonuclease VII large subunit [Deltaproteobacteria bacterium]|nr:exodeoxyribonuclease VII large subunit [Deltaproteobacteria bacterium]